MAVSPQRGEERLPTEFSHKIAPQECPRGMSVAFGLIFLQPYTRRTVCNRVSEFYQFFWPARPALCLCPPNTYIITLNYISRGPLN